jgi:hypothetical protein
MHRSIIIILLTALFSLTFDAWGTPRTSNIKKCTKRAEEIAEREIPKWFMQSCTHKTLEDDEKGLQAARLRRRWHISESLDGEILEAKCKLALHDLQDDGKNRKMREAQMNAADKKKDKLIAEYRSKKKLTNTDKDYLLAEGIIVNDDGSMSKTEDKLLTLNWHDINPANIDAFEWGTKFIKQCRDDPESYLSE